MMREGIRIEVSDHPDDDVQELNLDLLKQVVPKSVRNSVTQELIDDINSLCKDDIEREAYRENILTYSSVLNDGKFKVKDYLSACVYVTHKMMGCTNIDAFAKTFPARYMKYSATYSQKDFASRISVYNKSKLVVAIMQKTLVPTYVLYQDLNAEAIKVQADLMHSARSEMVRQKAAQSVFDMTKQPEELDIKVDVKSNNGDIIDRYEAALNYVSDEIIEKIKKVGDVHKLANLKLTVNDQN